MDGSAKFDKIHGRLSDLLQFWILPSRYTGMKSEGQLQAYEVLRLKYIAVPTLCYPGCL